MREREKERERERKRERERERESWAERTGVNARGLNTLPQKIEIKLAASLGSID